MAIDLSRTKLGNFDITWATYAFGAVDSVQPSITIKTKDIKVGSVGDVVLGKRIIALDGSIKVAAREIDLVLYKKMCPWWSSGSISLLPATTHKDLYDYANLLTLHPQDVSGTSEDLNFVKAVPIWSPMERDGEKDDQSNIEFIFFPDRAQLPTLIYGYIGAVP